MDDNPILDHTNAPFHRGDLVDATHSQYLRNSTCGDEVTIQLRIVSDLIECAWFTAAGCMVSRAAASILCEYVEGKSLVVIRKLGPTDMLRVIKVQLTPHRQQCALLPFRALQAAIEAGPDRIVEDST